MPKVLRGIYFQTEKGTNYYYDDCSGICFPCSTGLRQALSALESSNYEQLISKRQKSSWEMFLVNRHKAYGAFFSDNSALDVIKKMTQTEYEDLLIERGLNQLLLVVTGNCNLRCKYCIYSKHYPYSDSILRQNMPKEVALKAVDLYFFYIKKARQKNPAKRAVINFYGGEPLLNFPLIQEVVKYIKIKGIQNVTYQISTNGTLLSKDVSSFLVQEGFNIAISIDGPKPEHDRNRILSNGKGCFDLVFNNIESFWENYPDYKSLFFLVTHDFATNLYELQRFFSSRKQFREAIFMFSTVSSNFTNYYQQFSGHEVKHYQDTIRDFKSKISSFSKDKDPFMMYFISMHYKLFFLRGILTPFRLKEIPGTATCIPGHKLCVLPDGQIQPCERVHNLIRMGSVQDGLDYHAITNMIDEYNQTVTQHCKYCPIQRLCPFCFSHFWSGTAFRRQGVSHCQDHISSKKKLLSEAYSLVEKDPELYSYFMINDKFRQETRHIQC